MKIKKLNFLIILISLISIAIANIEFLASASIHFLLGTFSLFIKSNQSFFILLTSTLSLASSTFYRYNDELKPEFNPLALISLIFGAVLTTSYTILKIVGIKNSLTEGPFSLILFVLTSFLLIFCFLNLYFRDIRAHEEILQKLHFKSSFAELKAELGTILTKSETESVLVSTDELRQSANKVDKTIIGGKNVEI